ncbi:hypothetical protein ACFSQ7_37490 [Paenibacillus rhizoplanae]
MTTPPGLPGKRPGRCCHTLHSGWSAPGPAAPQLCQPSPVTEPSITVRMKATWAGLRGRP